MNVARLARWIMARVPASIKGRIPYAYVRDPLVTAVLGASAERAA